MPNRFLFEKSDLEPVSPEHLEEYQKLIVYPVPEEDVCLKGLYNTRVSWYSLHLSPDDENWQHIEKVLKLEVGHCCRCGVINGSFGRAHRMPEYRLLIEVFDHSSSERLNFHLILGSMHPKTFYRSVQDFAGLSLNTISVIQTSKAEASFFNSFNITNPGEPTSKSRKALVKGVQQCLFTTQLPDLQILKELKVDELLKPLRDQSRDVLCFLADHRANRRLFEYSPQEVVRRKPGGTSETPIKEVTAILAVGCEGGWTDEEIQHFHDEGFVGISFGDEILRTEQAIAITSAMIKEWCAFHKLVLR